jgi:hypothetical protein
VKLNRATPLPFATSVIFPGNDKFGARVSTTLMLKNFSVLLPDLSVAEQDTLLTPRSSDDPERGEQTAVRLPSTASFADTEKLATAPFGPVASSVKSLGISRSGGVESATSTLNESDALLPALSVAEQVTIVTPLWKTEPERGEHEADTEPSTTSDAAAWKDTIAPEPEVALTVKLSGKFRTGGLVSTTLTTNEPLALLPALSVAEQVTVVLPSLSVEPDSGLQLALKTPSTSSRADAR